MIGKTISHYKILEKLGGGGMGVVYKAEDVKLKRPVALKFLPSQLTHDEEAKKRFIHEAQAASALDHHNICTIHEIDETGEGQLFIVMTYYDGETLKKRIAKSAERGANGEGREEKGDERGAPFAPRSSPFGISIAETIEIAMQIVNGLAKAHEHGITHRDIKPANVMITKDGVVKILDFGLAKLAGRAKLTKTGSTMGTAAYMSPEQVHRMDADHRTDIWSLGVVMYEMLTAQLPFEGEYEQAIMYAIVNMEPRPLTSLRADMPSALESMVMKAMAKEPAGRYQHMDEMLVDLKSATKVSESRPVRTIKRRLPKKKRFFLYGGLVALLTLLMMIGLYFFSPRRETIDSIAVLPLANLSGDANQEYFADGMTEALISFLGQIEALRVISRTSVMQYKTAPKPLPEIAKELNVDAVVEGSAVSSGDRVSITVRLIEAKTEKRLWSQSFERELRDVFKLQREAALAIATEIEVRVTPQERALLQEARVIDPEAYELYLWGKKFKDKETPESLQQAVKNWELTLVKEPSFAPAYAELGKIYPFLAIMGIMPVKEAESKARHATSKALELDKTDAEAHIALGWIRANYDWDLSGAEEAFKRAIELNPGSREAHSSLALLLCYRGRSAEGLAVIKHAQRLDPLSEAVNVSVGEVYMYNRQYDAVIEQYRRVLAINPSSGWAYLMLGEAYLLKGMHEEAIAALKTKEAASLGIPDAFAMLGCAYALSGNRKESLKILDELGEREGGANTHVLLAMVHTCLNEKEEAFARLELAYDKRSDYLRILIQDPLFDPLRSEPRFRALLKKMRLES
jgi:serine/threonine-protein kinase